MKVNKFKQCVAHATKFIANRTSVDYKIATMFIRYGFKLFEYLDSQERLNFIQYVRKLSSIYKNIKFTRTIKRR